MNRPTERLRDWAAIAVMCSGGACMAFIFTAIAPILSAMSDALGGGTQGYVIGQFTMTMPDIGIIAGGPVVGWLLGRYGARAILLVSFLLFAASGTAAALAGGAVTLLATRLLLGFAGAGIATSTTALIGARFAGAARARALGAWSGIGAAGGVLSIWLAGQMAEASGSWRTPFALYLVTLPLLLLALPALPRGKSAAAAAVGRASLKGLWGLYAGIVPVYVAVFMTGVQLSFLVAADGITSPVTQSWIIGAASAGSFVGAVSYGFFQPRLGSRGTFLLFIGLMAAGNLLMAAFPLPLTLAAGGWLNGMGGGMANPYFAMVLLERATPEAQGRALGWLYTAMFFGEFANPIVVTPLAALLGIHGAFIFVAAALALTMAGRLVWRSNGRAAAAAT